MLTEPGANAGDAPEEPTAEPLPPAPDADRADDADGSFVGPTPESFLAAPPRLEGRRRRVHLIVIGALMLLTFGRGVLWSVTVVVWSPIDEAQHFGYIESLARGEGIPTVGRDLLSDEQMATVKDSPTFRYRSEPYQPTNLDAFWGGTRHQYEAIHGPTYYGLMAPAYWLGRPFGELGSLYAVRIASAALLALILPLTWLLGRRLFPDRPGVALGATALIATLNSLVPGQVANDGLAMILATLTALAFIRACNRADGWRWPVVAGALFGLTMVTKSTSLVIIPFVGVMIVGWLWATRPGWLCFGRLAVGAAAGAVAAFAPWLAWNFHAYGAPSASGASSEITAGYMGQQSLSLSGIWAHLTVARPGVWLSQLTQSTWYPRLWEITLAIAFVAGAAAIAWRRRWRDLAVFLWCASALPAAFLAMEVLVFALFGGSGGPMGRHLMAALPPTMIMVAAAVSFVVGLRLLPVVLAWFVAGMLVFDALLAANFVRTIYEPLALYGTYGPVVYQNWSDRFEESRDAVVLDAGCPTQYFGIGFATGPGLTPPPTLPVTTADGTRTEATYQLDFGFMPLYSLSGPVDGPITVTLPARSIMRASADDRSDAVSFRTGGREPVASVYCPTTDPRDTSFQALYPIGHPDVSSRLLLAGPYVIAGGAVVVALGLTAKAAADLVRDRRRASAATTV